MSVHNNINTAQVAGKLEAALQIGVYRAAAAIHTHAVSLTPIEQGDLRSSSTVKMVTEQSAARAAIAFNMIYATRQHEETGWQHPRGGQAKFLETALDQKQDEARKIIANHLRSVLNG